MKPSACKQFSNALHYPTKVFKNSANNHSITKARSFLANVGRPLSVESGSSMYGIPPVKSVPLYEEVEVSMTEML